MRMTATMFVGRCQHCPQEMEFEPKRSGEVVACPGCGMETPLTPREATMPFQPSAPIETARLFADDWPTPLPRQKWPLHAALTVLAVILGWLLLKFLPK